MKIKGYMSVSDEEAHQRGKAQALNLKTGGNLYRQCSGAKGKYRQVKYNW